MFNFIKENFLTEEENSIKLKYKIAFDLLLIAMLAFLAYAITLQNGFVIDDTTFILKWNLAHNLANIPKLLAGATPAGHEGVYRPLRGVFYAFSFGLWGTDAFWYHLQSILIHILSTIFVYFIAARITGKRSIGFVSSLLFGLHPLHTESVAYITAGFDNIGALFFFISFYFYLRSTEDSDIKIKSLIISLLFAILAFATYEITLMLPVLIFVYEIVFKKIGKSNFLKRFFIYSLYTAPALLYAIVRVFILHITYRGSYLANSFYLTMLTMAKVFLKWLILMVYPVHLSINPEIPGGIESWVNSYSDTSVITRQSVFNPDILLSIVVILALLILAFVYIKKYQIVSYCIFWIFISLLPVAYIFPQGFLMAERNGYISSFGATFLAGYIFMFALERFRKIQKILIIALIFIASVFFVLTLLRNKDWFDELSIWQSLSKQSVGSTKANIYVGNFLTNKGDYKGAIESYQKALKMEPGNVDVMYSLSLAYALNSQYDLARSEYNLAAEKKPGYTTSITHLIDDVLNKSQPKMPAKQ